MTRARVFNVNTKRSDVACPASQKWSLRRPKLVKIITEVAQPSILTVQECTPEQEKHLLADLAKWSKSAWKLATHGNSGVFWNTAKWTGTNARDFDLAAKKGELERRLAVVDLTSISTKERITVGATHLSVHYSGSAAYRIKQVDQICDVLKGDLNVVGADLNSTLSVKVPSPRQEFSKDQGMLGLRDKCTTKVVRGDWNTHHGFKPTKRNGDWLDEIETGKAIKVYAAEVIPTGTATDHNGLLARIEF
jgi:endonuclease/exonuclease/phosphatase family metal-dependent hydrolase